MAEQVQEQSRLCMETAGLSRLSLVGVLLLRPWHLVRTLGLGVTLLHTDESVGKEGTRGKLRVTNRVI